MVGLTSRVYLYAIYIYIPLDTKTTKNEGLKPPIYGLQPPRKNEGYGFRWLLDILKKLSERHQIRLRNVPWILRDMVYIPSGKQT